MNSTPAAARSVDENARLNAALIDLFERRIAFNAVLGLKVLSLQPGDVRGRIEMRPDLIGSYAHGRLHGGVISGVLDAMGGLALIVGVAERHPGDNTMQMMQRFARMGTVDLRVDYLRQGIGKHFTASTEITRLGGRIGTVQMRLVNDEDTLIATGSAAYVVA
ncbi:MAG TPA: thioesterase family protein [Rubrivivax sp.]